VDVAETLIQLNAAEGVLRGRRPGADLNESAKATHSMPPFGLHPHAGERSQLGGSLARIRRDF